MDPVSTTGDSGSTWIDQMDLRPHNIEIKILAHFGIDLFIAIPFAIIYTWFNRAIPSMNWSLVKR